MSELVERLRETVRLDPLVAKAAPRVDLYRLMEEAADALDAPLVLTDGERHEVANVVIDTVWRADLVRRMNAISLAIRDGRGIR